LEYSVNSISGGIVTDSIDNNFEEFFESDGSVDFPQAIYNFKNN